MIYLNKIVQKEDLQKYIDSNCVVHVISKYGKQDYANYVNLTKLLKDAIIIVSYEEDLMDKETEQLVDDLFDTTEGKSTSDEDTSKRKKIDRGKIIALHKAGWSGRKIADEMGCSVGTVYNVIKLHNRMNQLNN